MSKNKQTQTKISFWQKITLIIFGLFLTIIILEIGLCLGGFVILSLQEYRNRLSLKAKGAYRIMCLGESTTQNQYPRFLEEYLNQQNTGIRFSVIDKGVGGITTDIIVNQLESWITQYHPDMIITMMGINDYGKHVPYESPASSKSTLLLRSLRVYKLARLFWLHIVSKAEEIGLLKFQKTEQASGEADALLAASNDRKESPDILHQQLFMLYSNAGKGHNQEDNFLQTEEFIRDISKRIASSGLSPDDSYVELGISYRNFRRQAEAEESYKKAIELNPHNANAYAGLGELYGDQFKMSEAEASYKQAIVLNPEDINAVIGLGGVYMKQDRYSEAEKLFNQAITCNLCHERIDLVYGALALLYEEMGKLKSARYIL